MKTKYIAVLFLLSTLVSAQQVCTSHDHATAAIASEHNLNANSPCPYTYDQCRIDTQCREDRFFLLYGTQSWEYRVPVGGKKAIFSKTINGKPVVTFAPKGICDKPRWAVNDINGHTFCHL